MRFSEKFWLQARAAYQEEAKHWFFVATENLQPGDTLPIHQDWVHPPIVAVHQPPLGSDYYMIEFSDGTKRTEKRGRVWEVRRD